MAELLPWGRDATKVAAREQALEQAYEAVFNTGNSTQEQRQMVRLHMAQISGFYKVTPPPHDSGFLSYTEGKRASYGATVFRYTRISDDERRAYETAARATARHYSELDADSYRDEETPKA